MKTPGSPSCHRPAFPQWLLRRGRPWALARRAASACALAAWAATSAQASMVFTWETLSLSPTISQVQGSIRFADGFFPAGQPSSTVGCNGMPYITPGGVSAPGQGCVPFAGILDFSFSVNNSPVPLSYGSLRMVSTLGLDASGLLVGSIRAQSQQATDVVMSSGSAGSVWTITRFSSDAGPLACFTAPDYCLGATGRWVMSPVPEPASVLLMGLGAIGVASLVRLGRRPRL